MPSLHGCIRISFKFDLMRSLSCYMRRAYCLICLQSSPWLPSDATMTPSITTSLQKPMERSICVAHSMPTRPSSKKETSSRTFASSTLNDMNIHVPNSTKTIQNASASNERFAKTTTSTMLVKTKHSPMMAYLKSKIYTKRHSITTLAPSISHVEALSTAPIATNVSWQYATVAAQSSTMPTIAADAITNAPTRAMHASMANASR